MIYPATSSPLAGGRLSSWLKLLIDNRFRVGVAFWPRAMFVTCMTTVLTPLRLWQRLNFGRKIRRKTIEKDPVFIIGHFRSGTTYLQNLLAQDTQFGVVSTYHTLMPELFLYEGWLKKLFRSLLPEKRPMDNMLMDADLPEETEHGLANLSTMSLYHGFCFPRRMMHYVRKWGALENLSQVEKNSFWGYYDELLRAASYKHGGQQLMVKNPPDTMRIEAILARYPKAKFIYLYRNPFTMFYSIRNFYRATLKDFALQAWNEDELEEQIFDIFQLMFERYEAAKDHIPARQLVEVKFEEFETHTRAELERIYRELDLPGYDTAREALASYIDGQKSYKKNRYQLEEQMIAKINSRWAEAIRLGSYSPPKA